MVVDDIGQMIGGQVVGTLVEHLIVDDVALDTHLTTDEVVDEHLLSGLNLEAYDILATLGNESLDLFLRKGQRVAHHGAGLRVVLEVLNLCTLCFQFLWSVESDIGFVGVEQLFHILTVDVTTLALTVGTLVATERDALVELNAEPLERLDDVFLGTRHETVRVGVLNTEHQIAAVLTGKEVIIQGGTHTANM